MLLGLTLRSVCSAGGDCCCQGVQFTVYTYLISSLICFPVFEWGCLMGHKGRQLYICAADICFIIDSTPGKWSPQSPFLPPSPFFPPIPLVYFLLLLPSRCLHFLQFQVGWFLIKNNSVFVSQRATGKTPPVQSHLQLPSRGIYHIYAQNMWQLNPDNVKSSGKKKGRSNYIFVPHAHP